MMHETEYDSKMVRYNAVKGFSCEHCAFVDRSIIRSKQESMCESSVCESAYRKDRTDVIYKRHHAQLTEYVISLS